MLSLWEGGRLLSLGVAAWLYKNFEYLGEIWGKSGTSRVGRAFVNVFRAQDGEPS